MKKIKITKIDNSIKNTYQVLVDYLNETVLPGMGETPIEIKQKIPTKIVNELIKLDVDAFSSLHRSQPYYVILNFIGDILSLHYNRSLNDKQRREINKSKSLEEWFKPFDNKVRVKRDFEKALRGIKLKF